MPHALSRYRASGRTVIARDGTFVVASRKPLAPVNTALRCCSSAATFSTYDTLHVIIDRCSENAT